LCGIAGYSLSSASRIGRTLAAQALLAGIAERGADAAGYAFRDDGGVVTLVKRRAGASALLEDLHIPDAATQALVHVRDYTKGHPSIEANNHPIRHGAVVGIHNGRIVNDEEIFAEHGFSRAEPEMTVDSEAIFALVEVAESRVDVLEQLRGTMATAWLDERLPDVLFVARAVGRPLWLGRGKHETFFASTRDALEVVEASLRTTLRKSEVDEGTLVALRAGKPAWSARFTPDRSHVEEPLPAVRAAEEGVSCLSRLAAIVAAAA
jgi:glucosamine 6-phosphate synthetase-like amidotransferase/phosphosugar isomerase protein